MQLKVWRDNTSDGGQEGLCGGLQGHFSGSCCLFDVIFSPETSAQNQPHSCKSTRQAWAFTVWTFAFICRNMRFKQRNSLILECKYTSVLLKANNHTVPNLKVHLLFVYVSQIKISHLYLPFRNLFIWFTFTLGHPHCTTNACQLSNLPLCFFSLPEKRLQCSFSTFLVMLAMLVSTD